MSCWPSSVLYDPIYAIQGTTAHLTTADGIEADIVTLDKSTGVALGTEVGVQTIVPAAVVRMEELATFNLTPDDVDDASLLLNGQDWKIDAHQSHPGPVGELTGELWLILRKA
jgi:hypothetical protein